jgi:hypothetical protein
MRLLSFSHSLFYSHAFFLLRRVAFHAHTEPKIIPMLAAAPNATVTVQVIELATEALAIEGRVKCLSTMTFLWAIPRIDVEESRFACLARSIVQT